ncbi:phage tail assembly chaperone [Sphingorhabdus soli]|uniref:Phage tail assembly chaperone n=1 Tax=Flavisphingopyxis soli TaxID=2601267 RepID=A0A5C6U6U6_9SPHN|nr:phage tail assembly chaperone [Sphingorhabdus soli]TXC68190.1 phage tail assembly chaperone [Sphingorhabdus soli]
MAVEFAATAARLAGAAGWLLHWCPDNFWAATPAELAAVLRAAAGEDGEAAVTRADLTAMQERFPDG